MTEFYMSINQCEFVKITVAEKDIYQRCHELFINPGTE